MNAIIRKPSPQNNLKFLPAGEGQVLQEGVTILRVDGYWQTPDGRTLFIACSAPGSILRPPQ